MQSLFTRRRVESRWNGEAGFRIQVVDHPSEHSSPGTPVVGGRRDVRGDGDWPGANFEHDNA